jgi:bifunctional non-homologous end joining protein LigD
MPPFDTGDRDGYVPPCIPTRAYRVPSGPGWVHEIKHDGYRLQVRREGDAVRLFTRRGYDWTGRYPAIGVTALPLRARSFTLDGEAVVCGPDGVAIFDALHRRGTVTEAMLYAFDLLELDGEDLRSLPLGVRKKRLARLLGKRRLGIVLSEHTDEDGATIFQQACRIHPASTTFILNSCAQPPTSANIAVVNWKRSRPRVSDASGTSSFSECSRCSRESRRRSMRSD